MKLFCYKCTPIMDIGQCIDVMYEITKVMKYIRALMEMACNEILRSKSKVKNKQSRDECIKFYKL